MRIIVNKLLAKGNKTGVGHYTAELIRGLVRLPDLDVEVFPRPWMQKLRTTWSSIRSGFTRRVSRGDKNAALNGPGRPANLRNQMLGHLRSLGQAWMARQFQSLCRRQSFDVYHETNYIPLPSELPTISTIYDLSVLLYPQWHPADRVKFYERHFASSLSRCRHLIAISDACRDEIVKHLNMPIHRVTRTYLGIRSHFRPLPLEEVRQSLKMLGLPQNYLLAIGTIEPRKNIHLLLQAYCDLPANLREKSSLLLAGGWGWNAEPVAEYYQKVARHKGVRLIGYVRERYLPALYNGARALVYPSHYEGFGLPPLEMMACGGPVLASRAQAVVETVGNQAWLTPADDLEGWRDALARVIRDDGWHAELSRGAREVAKPFTWERCALETLQVYRHVGGRAALPLPLRAAG